MATAWENYLGRGTQEPTQDWQPFQWVEGYNAPQGQGGEYSVNDMPMGQPQYDQLKTIDMLAKSGMLDPETAGSMVSQSLLTKPDPMQQMMDEYMMQYMQGMMGEGQQGQQGMGQQPMMGGGGGYGLGGMGLQDLAIEVPDAELSQMNQPQQDGGLLGGLKNAYRDIRGLEGDKWI